MIVNVYKKRTSKLLLYDVIAITIVLAKCLIKLNLLSAIL